MLTKIKVFAYIQWTFIKTSPIFFFWIRLCNIYVVKKRNRIYIWNVGRTYASPQTYTRLNVYIWYAQKIIRTSEILLSFNLDQRKINWFKFSKRAQNPRREFCVVLVFFLHSNMCYCHIQENVLSIISFLKLHFVILI